MSWVPGRGGYLRRQAAHGARVRAQPLTVPLDEAQRVGQRQAQLRRRRQVRARVLQLPGARQGRRRGCAVRAHASTARVTPRVSKAREADIVRAQLAHTGLENGSSSAAQADVWECASPHACGRQCAGLCLSNAPAAK